MTITDWVLFCLVVSVGLGVIVTGVAVLRATKGLSEAEQQEVLRQDADFEFAKQMMLLAVPEEPFEPAATYDPDGDCIEFLAKPDPFYGDGLNDWVTLYRSQETDEAIGLLFKGITSQWMKDVAHPDGRKGIDE